LPWFDRAIEVDDHYINARLERAATLGEMGATRAMLAETRNVLGQSSGNAMAFYLQAVLAARAGNFTLARSLMQRTQGRLDGEPSAMLVQSGIDLAVGDPKEAAGRLSQLLAMQPDNRKARRLLAAAQWKSGDAAGTVATLRPLAERPDADSYSLALIGKALARLGDSRAASGYLARAAFPDGREATAFFEEPDAIAALRGEARAQPDNARAQVRLIRALLNNGNAGEALDRAKALRDANPGAPDSHLLVGDALAFQKQYRAAADAYRKAANIAFTEPVAMRLIDALDRAGDDDAAGSVLDVFLQQTPRSVAGRLLIANRFMAARRWSDAIRVYEDLRRQTGNTDAMMLNNLALAYFERGNRTAALETAKRAWQLDRANPATNDTFGWLLYKSGVGKAQGLALMESAANAAPDSDSIAKHLAAAKAN
jgi:tetratricopeptide (TPR) repeat protein